MIKNDEHLMQMCKNIKLLRERKGLTVKELSKVSKVSEYMIKNIENGIITGRMSITHLFRLCVFFGIKAYKIFSPLE